VKPRKLFALEENHATSGAREQRRSRAAGRSASYDRDVVHAAAHAHDGSVARIAFKERRLPSRHVSKSTAAQAVVPWNTDATGRRFKPFMLKFATQDEADRSVY
jgi:hypothetical protein